MCMSRVSKSFIKKLLGLHPSSGTGYKIFLTVEGKLHSPVYDYTNVERPTGVWITDDNPGQHANAGFHIYLKYSDAIRAMREFIQGHNEKYYIVHKVRYQSVVAYGRGDGMSRQRCPIVVARQMFIEP